MDEEEFANRLIRHIKRLNHNSKDMQILCAALESLIREVRREYEQAGPDEGDGPDFN